MRFAYQIPWWLLAGVLALVVAVAIATYRRAGGALGPARRAALVALRVVALASLVVILLRPVAPAGALHREGTVAVVIDSSRSMELRDDGGATRYERAVSLVRDRLVPALADSFQVEVFSGSDEIRRVELERLSGSARADHDGGAQTDLRGLMASVEERHRRGALTGIVLVSDGAESAFRSPDASAAGDRTPVITVGVGGPVKSDREVRSVTAAPSVLDGSLVDIAVTTVVRGEPARARVRLLQNGRVVEIRERTTQGGSPVQHVFTVAPDRGAPTVFRVEIEETEGELTVGNNRMDVLVPPPGRRRRVLMLEGAPGFEHTFLKRAWHQDTSLEIDAVVRKGFDDQGSDTYYVQAAGSRSAALSLGFPETKEALFAYDTVVLANRDLESLTREQLDWLATFVSERGGGLLLFGSRTLSGTAVDGTSFASVIPVDLSDRQGDIARAASVNDPERLKVLPTSEGLRHPMMRLSSRDENRRERWTALPPLAGAVTVGSPRPGAAVLALTATAAGATVPLVTVQRFGRGRAMVFSGEASWRWKMMMPASDRSFETFWRQAVRWLAVQSPDPVAVSTPAAVPVGATVPIDATVRDATYAPIPDAEVRVTVRGPDGAERTLPAAQAGARRGGRYSATVTAAQPGVFRIDVVASRGGERLSSAEQLVLAGGTDPELIDPGLNEPVLRRMAEASGGRYVPADEVETVAALLSDAMPPQGREMRDLWHNAWSFFGILTLLSVEWILRRRWGLR